MIVAFLAIFALLSTFEGELPWVYVTYLGLGMSLIGMRPLTNACKDLTLSDGKTKPIRELSASILSRSWVRTMWNVWLLLIGLHALTGAPWFFLMSNASFFNPYLVAIGFLVGLTGAILMIQSRSGGKYRWRRSE